jgi:hypothetical protein
MPALAFSTESMRIFLVTSPLTVLEGIAPPLPLHLSAEAVERLAAGIRAFLIEADAIDEEFDESGALAGRFRIELSEIAVETLVMAVHVIAHANDPDRLIESVPAVADWLNKIRTHIDALDRRSGELCLYKGLLQAGNDSTIGGISSQALIDGLPCRLRIFEEPKCRFHNTWGCKIAISDFPTILETLKKRGAICEGANDQWSVR